MQLLLWYIGSNGDYKRSSTQWRCKLCKMPLCRIASSDLCQWNPLKVHTCLEVHFLVEHDIDIKCMTHGGWHEQKMYPENKRVQYPSI